MKRKLTALLALSMALSLFSGCGRQVDNSGYVPTGDAILMEGQEPEDIEKKEETQELTLAYYPDRSLNPVFGSDYTNRVLMSLMYQGLFAVDSKKNVTPILASGYRSSADNKTWVVYLDEKATFSDGSRVTPQDVVATYKRAKENDYYKGRFKFHLADVQVTDDGGIAFYMMNPFGNLPLVLDIPIIKESQLDETIPLGTGPYVFQQGVNGSYLQRNENWWCKGVEIPATDSAIALVSVTSPADIRDQFQFGELSLACTNPMSGSFAEYRCDYEMWEIESGQLMYIGCNIQWSDFYPEQKPLRTFLTYAIDRETLSKSIYRGMADPVTLPASPNESYYNQNLAQKYAYDSLHFVGELSQFTIPNKKEGGGKQTLRLLVNSDDSNRVQVARTLAKNLTEFGLTTETIEKTTGGFRDVLVNGNYDIYLGMTRLPPTMDMSEFFRLYGELSWGGLPHETLRDMSLRTLEDVGNFYNFYKKLAEDGRVIPVLFGYNVVYAQRGLIPNLNPSRDNVFYYSIGKDMEASRVEKPAATEPQE